MAALDLSLVQDFSPILVFLLVFTVVFAVLAKTKILGEDKWVHLFIAFLTATLFVAVTNAREYIIGITPWFAVFVVSLMFILAIAGFTGKLSDSLTKGIGSVFIVGLLLVFLISGFYTFSSEPFIDRFKDWLFRPRVYGVILLVAAGALASWVLVKAGGKK